MIVSRASYRRGAAQARSVMIPPPVGGWDTRASLAEMPEKNAHILVNWFPETEKVTIRPGSASHATGLGGSVQTLMDYTKVDGTNQLYGCANGDIFNVTSSGAVGAAVVSGMTNNKWQHVNMGTSGGQFLLAFNGADTPRTFDGTTWSTFGGTGPTVANLIWANIHMKRLWVGEVASLDAWYGGTNAITGTWTKFPLAGVFNKGGYIMSMGTWTRDSGSGNDDVAVFMTSEGQVAIYAGQDVSSSTTWSLVGVFDIGRPLGRRCMIKAGADLVIVTEDGFVPASQILLADRSQSEIVAISKQINDAVNTAVRDYGTFYGWQPIIHNTGQMLIFNIPLDTANADAYQYVFNSITGAPCKFKGLPAVCWGKMGNQVFFGKNDGTVWEFDKANQLNDGGSNIEADMVPAFNAFRSPSREKVFKQVNCIFESISSPAPALDMNVDFQVGAPSGVSAVALTSSARWGISHWGVGTWGTNAQVYQGWRSVRGKGRFGSLRLRINTKDTKPSLLATYVTYVPGGLV